MTLEPTIEWSLPESLAELARDGDEDLVSDILTSFRIDGGARLDRIQAALTATDRSGVRLQAHTLKGGALQVGADEVASLCRELELAADTESPADLAGLLTRIERSFLEVCDAMDSRNIQTQ